MKETDNAEVELLDETLTLRGYVFTRTKIEGTNLHPSTFHNAASNDCVLKFPLDNQIHHEPLSLPQPKLTNNLRDSQKA